MLLDCVENGSHTEILIVEGHSAADAVARVRLPRQQAVLAMQGKPPNVERMSDDRIRNNSVCRTLFETLGCGANAACDNSQLRYGRILIAMDAGRDGSHCRFLLLRLFQRALLPLLEARLVDVVHPPLLRIRDGDGACRYASTPEHVEALQAELQRGRASVGDVTQFRGLAQLTPAELFRFVVNPASRSAARLTV